MPLAEATHNPKAVPDFLRLVGAKLWASRLADLGQRAQSSAFLGRATQHRHALEFALARAARGAAQGSAERRALGFAAEAVRLAHGLPAARRERLRAAIADKIFERSGVRYDPATEIVVTIGASEAVDLAQVDGSLAALLKLSVAERRNFVRACGIAVLSDGRAEPREVEILRAVADSLGISFATGLKA